MFTTDYFLWTFQVFWSIELSRKYRQQMGPSFLHWCHHIIYIGPTKGIVIFVWGKVKCITYYQICNIFLYANWLGNVSHFFVCLRRKQSQVQVHDKICLHILWEFFFLLFRMYFVRYGDENKQIIVPSPL